MDDAEKDAVGPKESAGRGFRSTPSAGLSEPKESGDKSLSSTTDGPLRLVMADMTISDADRDSRIGLTVSRADTAEATEVDTLRDANLLDDSIRRSRGYRSKTMKMARRRSPKPGQDLVKPRRARSGSRSRSRVRESSSYMEIDYDALLADLVRLSEERRKARESDSLPSEQTAIQKLNDFADAVVLAAAATAASLSAERDVGPSRAKTIRRTILRGRKGLVAEEAGQASKPSELIPNEGASDQGSLDSIGADDAFLAADAGFEYDDTPYPASDRSSFASRSSNSSRSSSRQRRRHSSSSGSSDEFFDAPGTLSMQRMSSLRRRGTRSRRPSYVPAIPPPDAHGTTNDSGMYVQEDDKIAKTLEETWETSSSSSLEGEGDETQVRTRTFFEALAVRTGETLSYLGSASIVATAPLAVLAGPAVAGLVSTGGGLATTAGEKVIGKYGRKRTIGRVKRMQSAMKKLSASNLLERASERLVEEGLAGAATAKLIAQGAGTLLENGMVGGSASLIASGIAASATSAALDDSERAHQILSNPSYLAAADYLSYIASVSPWLLPPSLRPIAEAVGAVAGGVSIAPAVMEAEHEVFARGLAKDMESGHESSV